jgi:hypothetical protein
MLIGIVGKSGAGKSTVAQYLEQEHGFTIFHAQGHRKPSTRMPSKPVRWGGSSTPEKLPPKAVIVGTGPWAMYNVCRSGEAFNLIIEVTRDNPYRIPGWEAPDVVLFNRYTEGGPDRHLFNAVDDMLKIARARNRYTSARKKRRDTGGPD